jgi:peptidoglycan/LPS O-acetylase OafA/YrhL
VEKIRSQSFDWKNYLVNRVSRLYPVLLAALLAGWGLDYIGWRFLNSAGLYTVTGPDAGIGVMNYDASQRLGLISFLFNLFMLQGIYGPTFGTNGNLWSLSMEFWYYLMFPAGVIFLGTRTWKRLFCWNTLLLLGLLIFLPLIFHAYFVIWLMGVAVAVIPIPFRRALPWLVVLLAALINSNFGFGKIYLRDLCVGAACSLLIGAVKNGSRFPPAFARTHERLSGFSYSLYLFHFPLLIFCLSVLNECGLWNRSSGMGERFALFGALLLICVGISYGLSRLTEAKTPEVRKVLLGWFGGRNARPKE